MPEAAGLLRFALTRFVEEVREPVAGLGMGDLRGVVAIDASGLVETVRATFVLDISAIADEELEDQEIALAARYRMGADRTERSVRAVLGIPKQRENLLLPGVELLQVKLGITVLDTLPPTIEAGKAAWAHVRLHFRYKDV